MTTREELVEATTAEAVPEEKRGRGRPRKVRPEDVLLTREERVPLGGFRDILTLKNTDPNYHYHWPLDSAENGTQITRYLQAGYVFVRPEEGVIAGESAVYSTKDLGNVMRVPAGNGDFHFLMKLPMAYYEEDMRLQAEKVNLTEQSLKDSKSGFYGGLTTG